MSKKKNYPGKPARVSFDYNKISIRVFADLQKPTLAFQRGGRYAHPLLDNEFGIPHL